MTGNVAMNTLYKSLCKHVFSSLRGIATLNSKTPARRSQPCTGSPGEDISILDGKKDSEGLRLSHVYPVPTVDKFSCALSHPWGNPNASRAHCPDGSFMDRKAPTPLAMVVGKPAAGQEPPLDSGRN